MMKVEKMLKESRVRLFGFTINIYLYLLITVAFTLYIFNFSKGFLHNNAAALLLAGVAAITPHEILMLEVNLKRRTVRKNLPNFYLVLSQLHEASDDIIEVLEIAVPKMKGPIRRPFKEFLTSYKSGKSLNECKEILQSRFENPTLIRFAEDIENNIQNGTQLKGVLEEYIIKAYNNEINYMERITENSGSLAGSIMVLGMFLLFTYNLKNIRPEFINILIYNPAGKVTVVILIVLIIIASLIMKHSISYQDSK